MNELTSTYGLSRVAPRETVPLRTSGLITVKDIRQRTLDPRIFGEYVRQGSYVRVAPGAYCSTEHWRSLSEMNRHLMIVEAHSLRRPGAIYSHLSAAALHGLPVIGTFPSEVHVRTGLYGGGYRRHSIAAHSGILRSDEIVTVRGFTVTSVARTAADLGSALGFSHAVASADAALFRGMASHSELDALAARLDGKPGTRIPAAVLRFADGRSESPGESLSRALMHELGFATPQLQVAHPHSTGIDYVDFEWPEYRVIGEFDGKGKYLREEFLKGATPGETVFREKVREDRLRSGDSRVARWIWADLTSPPRLRAILIGAGVPLRL